MKEIAILIIASVVLYWFFILRPGRLDFWKFAAKHPDAAYDHFMSSPCWKVFENQLPENYRSIVPKIEWVGPFRLIVPKLGNKTIHVFGKHPEFDQSQSDFVKKWRNNT